MEASDRDKQSETHLQYRACLEGIRQRRLCPKPFLPCTTPHQNQRDQWPAIQCEMPSRLTANSEIEREPVKTRLLSDPPKSIGKLDATRISWNIDSQKAFRFWSILGQLRSLELTVENEASNSLSITLLQVDGRFAWVTVDNRWQNWICRGLHPTKGIRFLNSPQLFNRGNVKTQPFIADRFEKVDLIVGFYRIEPTHPASSSRNNAICDRTLRRSPISRGVPCSSISWQIGKIGKFGLNNRICFL